MINCFGQQHPAVSQPGYNPTVPRLISMHPKAVSHDDKPVRPTIQDFEQKVNKEEINVFVEYPAFLLDCNGFSITLIS
jgi:hypothetical protein